MPNHTEFQRFNARKTPVFTVDVKRLFVQSRIAETYARLEAALDEREDECIRMFGGDVTYVQDERIIHHG